MKNISPARQLLLVPLAVFLIAPLSGCLSSQSSRSAEPTFSEFQQRAGDFNSVLALPGFETTAEEVRTSITNAITTAERALDLVGQLAPDEVNFDNTIKALDDIGYQAGTVANRVYLLKESSENAEIRDAATDMIKVFQEWAVGLDYREDVHAAVQAYAATQPTLEGESLKLFEETLRDYRRAGLALPKPERDEVERLRKELSNLETDFQSNITAAQLPLKFTRADLEGVPESFLSGEGIKTGDDEYTVMANITFHFIMVMENAGHEATRKRLKTARYSLAMDGNTSLLQQIVELRDTIARKLGYDSWADYRIEPKMAKTARTARDFVEELVAGLQPKFDAEIEEFRKLKARHTGDPDAQIRLWDWRYYSNQLKKEKYTVDAEQLRAWFPYEQTLDGMFDIYQRLFGLDITRVEAPYKWTDSLQLHVVSDARTGEPLGCFYLDMFPREGKYNHFAQFGIIQGKRLPDGRYQRPTVSLVCNFPPPSGDMPSLLSHQEVETLFHEFGHVLHSLLTRADYSRFSGTSVPRDFVEAPSQMLENWVWDKQVLDSFAAHYEDPDRKIPAEILDRLEEAKLATIGTFYRRQLSFALLDLALHTDVTGANQKDSVALSNRILADVFFPVPENSAFVAYFGHLMGYDAGYYGYAWADAISADMATVFENAPDRYFDSDAGRKLRDEIYAPGGSRDANISIRRFLGRERRLEPFLENLGIRPPDRTAASP
ncbi:MAG TPA: M3 family metallopeptidase [Methylomirabilota bacterium]|nr:M3 family metallopeptidase [Methylomirabilota bacterium]